MIMVMDDPNTNKHVVFNTKQIKFIEYGNCKLVTENGYYICIVNDKVIIRRKRFDEMIRSFMDTYFSPHQGQLKWEINT